MNNPARLVLITIVGCIGALLFWQTARGMYFEPRSDLLQRLAEAEDDERVYRQLLAQGPRQQRTLQSIVNRTLGSDLETVDHTLRTRLNRISEDIGLERASVTTTSPSAKRSPAHSMFRGRSPVLREMREMIDFVEIEGTVSGEGSLAMVIELIDRIEAKPWLKQIHEVRLNPQGPSNGERFTVTLRLRTLFLPDGQRMVPGTPEEPTVQAAQAYDDTRLARFASLVDANPFRLPSAPAPAPTDRPEAPPSPPRFPYGQWLLTGVAELPANSAGVEAWLLNRSSGERRVLVPGETLGEAVFIAVQDDQAVFEMDETRFLVQVGGNLNHRTPVNK